MPFRVGSVGSWGCSSIRSRSARLSSNGAAGSCRLQQIESATVKPSLHCIPSMPIIPVCLERLELPSVYSMPRVPSH